MSTGSGTGTPIVASSSDESTLSVAYADLKVSVAHYLGLSLTSTDWSADELALINMLIKKGLRQFYKPPKVFDDEPPHRWSFLSPVGSVLTSASYATGTIELVNGDATVVLTDGVWPAWAATHGTLAVNGSRYAIASRTNDSEIELAEAWSGDSDAEASFALEHDGNYDMDDDFGGVDGHYLTHGEGAYKPDIRIVSEGEIRRLRNQSVSRGEPRLAALRPKNTIVSTSSGQRFEMMFFPIPDAAYTLYFNKIVNVDMVDDTHIYPLGGMAYGDCIEKSCLAAAETSETDRRGVKWEDFIAALTSAIREDQTAMTSKHFGYNGDCSDELHADGSNRRRHRSDVLVTYNGKI
jgi:hypothetical protein